MLRNNCAYKILRDNCAYRGSIGTTKSKVLRKAIALMEVAVEAKEQHNLLGIFEEKRHLVREIVEFNYLTTKRFRRV